MSLKNGHNYPFAAQSRCSSKGQMRSHLSLFPWSQPLCSAVARMFVGCVRAHGRGEASAEDSILFPPRRPAGRAGAGAYDGENSITPFSSAIFGLFQAGHFRVKTVILSPRRANSHKRE